METLEIILVSFVAVEHIYFLILEMFLWNTPKGIKTFGIESAEFAEKTKVLAAFGQLVDVIFGAVEDYCENYLESNQAPVTLNKLRKVQFLELVLTLQVLLLLLFLLQIL